jgi:hypothetical protein
MRLLRRWQETNWYSTLGAKVAVALLATAAAVLLSASSGSAQTPTFTPTVSPTGFLQVCKQALRTGPLAPTGNYTFSVVPASGPTQSVTVPMGACSNALQLNSGSATITETGGPLFESAPIFSLASVVATGTSPSVNRLVSENLATNSAVVTIVGGDITTQTIASFINQGIIGQVKVCKVLGPGVANGTQYQFSVAGFAFDPQDTTTNAKPIPANFRISVPAGPGPAGNCVVIPDPFRTPIDPTIPARFIVNPTDPSTGRATITELIPAGQAVSAILPNPASRQVSQNTGSGQVIITVGNGTTELTYTDSVTGAPTFTLTPTLTRTPTLTPTPNATQAAALTATAVANVVAPAISGTPGVPCVTQVGQTCTVVPAAPGGVSGTASKVGSFNFTVNATAPAGTVANTSPIIFVSTTIGVESNVNSGFTCSAVAGAAAQTVCQGTTRGDVLQGGEFRIRFTTAGAPGFTDLVGNAFGAGVAGGVVGAIVPVAPPVGLAGQGLPFAVPQVGIPAVPRPPVQFIPSAPPPLLPPSGQLGPLQQSVGGVPAAPPRYPEVPVIPESDSLALVLGGLAAIGAVALYRRRRD